MTSHDSDPQAETTERLAPAARRGHGLTTTAPAGRGADGPTVAVPAAVPPAGPPPAGRAPFAGPPRSGFPPLPGPAPAGIAPDGLAPPAPRPAWRRHPVLLTVGVVVIVVLAIVATLTLIFVSTTTSTVERKLTDALQSQLRLPVSELSCPALTGPGLELHWGTEFHCSATVDSVPVTLTVTPVGSGPDDLHAQVDDVVLPSKLTARTEQVVSETVGMPVAARCGTSPRVVLIAPPGSMITCSLTAANRRTTTLTWIVEDHAGNVHIVTDAAAVRAALR